MDAGIFYVLVGAVIVAAIAKAKGWPAPLLVTVVALAVSFLPAVPNISIDGHVLLNVVLPPLLYSAALDVSFVSFRRSLPHIRRLGIGLVLVTTATVGIVAYAILPALTLPGALLLGAIVAPPDAVSAAAIGRRLGLPRRVMTVLSGESLINDATSLTLFRVFAAILAGATLTVWDGIGQFTLAVIVGVGVGLLFGVVVHQLRMRVSDPVVIGTFGLLVPFGAYAIAEHLQGSGVLAVVAMGLFIGYNGPRTAYTTRQQEGPLWLSADFLLESFVFAYIGLQFPRVLSDFAAESTGNILLLSTMVLLAVLLVRPVFVYLAYAWGQWLQRGRLRRWERAKARGRHPVPTEARIRSRLVEPTLSWKDNAVVSWAGMRGVVTLATAVAAADLAGLGPVATRAIVIVAFIVTVSTLLLQGLTLPLLIRVLGVADGSERQEDDAQLDAVRARTRGVGKEYLERQRAEWATRYGPAELAVFDRIASRLTRIETETDRAQQAVDGEAAMPRPSYDDLIALSKGWLKVRREILLKERDAGTLNEEVMRELIMAMDAEELALDTRGMGRLPGRP